MGYGVRVGVGLGEGYHLQLQRDACTEPLHLRGEEVLLSARLQHQTLQVLRSLGG